MKLEEAIERLSKFADIKMLYGKHLLITTSQQHDIKEAINTVLQHVKHLQKENERYKRIKPVSIDGEYEIDLEEFLNVSDKLYELERNSISKDKIRELIEMWKPKLEETDKREEKAKTKEERVVLKCIGIRLDERIKTLQDLLKEE